LPSLPAPEQDTIEFDELCIRLTPSLWLWVGVSRLVKHVLGFAIGGREDAMLSLAWSDIPEDYLDKPVATDYWGAYSRFFTTEQHFPCEKGRGLTSIVEACNTKWRHRHPGLTRKSCGVHWRILDDLIERFFILAEQHGIQAIRRYKKTISLNQ
jgi:IS1 family transposase